MCTIGCQVYSFIQGPVRTFYYSPDSAAAAASFQSSQSSRRKRPQQVYDLMSSPKANGQTAAQQSFAGGLYFLSVSAASDNMTRDFRRKACICRCHKESVLNFAYRLPFPLDCCDGLVTIWTWDLRRTYC
jgi:hypothetical protein